ncbi:MAG: tricarballylate utilization 4Fe-4S protein TcuB [Candidatus Eremiobacteraeota bacterium]|nr:tricarballylate utilization 4Fe-4S protein TcuB [Candidatus Eremiobacteraeota bacterium]
MPWLDSQLADEGARIMTICNACRYCEGYCEVFPAMERRQTFGAADLSYLANLCHNCGACLPACQYAPPHEFGVNVPQTLAQIRLASYRGIAPYGAGRDIFRIAALVCALFVLATIALASPAVVFAPHDGGAFFDVVPHNAMVVLFALAGLFALAVIAFGVRGFWRQSGGAGGDAAAVLRGLHDAFALTNLDGGGDACGDARRTFHHLTFYGFFACFAATVVAAFYDNVLGWRAPYPVLSVPVVLGTAGGITLLAGSAGLLYLIGKRDPAMTDVRQRGMDSAFIGLLLLTAATGLLLLALRGTAAMGILLAIHLGVVLGLFVTMPYGKFVHGFYRVAALVRAATERAG